MSEGGGASRSTDPAAGTSSATDVSLREYLTSLITAAERRSDARFEALKETVDTAFKTAKTAIDKADAATDIRFESMNEFNTRIDTILANTATRDWTTALADKLSTQIERNREDHDALARRIDLREGAISGSRLTWGNMAALLASFATVIGLVVVLANYLSVQ